MPIILSSAPSSPPQGADLTVLFSAHGQPGAQLSVAFAARRRPPAELTVLFSAAGGTPAPTRSPLLKYSAQFTGLPGEVRRVDYAWAEAGRYEECSVTVDGLHGLAAPHITVTLRASERGGGVVGELPTRAFSSLSAEPSLNLNDRTTTFLFRNSFDQALRGLKLPECIAWKLSPARDACVVSRRTQNVSALVCGLLREYADPGFALEDDPLAGEQWEEGRTDFSTENLTLQGLWDATYGALGMVLGSVPRGSGLGLVGRWPEPIQIEGGPHIPDDWRRTEGPQRQFMHTPTALTVRGADFVTSLTPQTLLDWVGADPARTEIEREVLPGGEWIEEGESAGTARTRRGYRRYAGQVVAQLEVTTDDVEVRETVDGEEQVRLFRGVGTGVKQTTTTFDPLCPTRPVSQRTLTRAWAYHLGTVTGSYLTPGPGLHLSLTVGDPVAEESTLTTYRYSPQGFLAAQTTQTRRLASVQQVGAEEAPEERGAVTGREFITTSRTERWWPTGGGRWMYDPGTQGQTLMALYDQESGEAVRTVSVARAAPEAPRLTDQAPPSYDCAACTTKDIHDPTGVILRAGDAGHGEERELNLPFLSPASLVSVVRRIMAANWHRVVTSFEVPFPVGYTPGTALSDGRVRELRITVDEGGQITSRLTAARLDTSLMPPENAGVYDLTADPRRGKAVVLTRGDGGVRARVVTGWQAVAGQPRAELNAFVRLPRGAASPGDELDWELTHGVREARSAR